MKIDWLGHATSRITAGDLVIYFDPFQIENSPKGDILLISHGHYDHCSSEDIAKLLKDDSAIVCAKDCDTPNKSQVMTAGEQITVKGVKIKAVPSYNVGKKFHPQSAGGLGFIIQVDDQRVYHAGDTDIISEMEGINCDVALLPVSGTYVMNAQEAADAARMIKPKVAIPVHYGSGVIGTVDDALLFKNYLEDTNIEVEIKEKAV